MARPRKEEFRDISKHDDEFIPRFELWLDEDKEKLISKTASLCPSCLRLVPAFVFEADDKVWIRKVCSKHGAIEEIYWSDAKLYEKARSFEAVGKGVQNPSIGKPEPSCPHDCGLCNLHTSHTALANIVVTNRCDLNCWYCFFFAEKSGYVYEPTMEELRAMAKMLKDEKPIPCNAVQLTGGNPELREDLVDIVKMFTEEGFEHVQLNVNATHRIWRDLEYVKQLREAGVNTIYLSFDGVTPKTNPKNFWEIPGILDNCRKAGIGIVLVPTVVNTVNDHEVGDIIKFALKNIDVVRGVNFQPVSLVGRVPTSERKRFRITIPDVIKKVEAENGIPREAWYPVPCTSIFTDFVETITGIPYYEMISHPACGMATYLFKDEDRVIPITDFVNVDGLFAYLKSKTEELKSGKSKFWLGTKMLFEIGKFIDKKKAPKGFDVAKILLAIALKRDYSALAEFHHKSLFLGMMHFQDLYNWDMRRTKRCCIHYATQDGIIPFCTFNVIPQWYRDKIQRKYSIPLSEWYRNHGRQPGSDLYRRDPSLIKNSVKNLLDLPVPEEISE